MEHWLKKYFAGVVLVLIAIAAYYQASGVSSLLGAALGHTETDAPSSSVAEATVWHLDDHVTSARPILDRNPFDSVTRRPLGKPALPSSSSSRSPKASDPTNPPKDNAPADGSVPPDIASRIEKIGANEFNVDRQAMDNILENQTELMRHVRIVPEQANGKAAGFRLFGIQRGALLDMLGLENGDRLQAINGFELSDPQKALEAYARLRMADHLTAQINRRGQNLNIDYWIK